MDERLVERMVEAFEAVFYADEPQDVIRPMNDAMRAALSVLEGPEGQQVKRPARTEVALPPVDELLDDEGNGTSGPGDCGPSTVDALRPRLQNLTRYDMGIDRGCGWADTKPCTVDVEQWDDGEWVRYADVLTALEPKAAGTVAGAEGGGHNPDLTAAGGQEQGE